MLVATDGSLLRRLRSVKPSVSPSVCTICHGNVWPKFQYCRGIGCTSHPGPVLEAGPCRSYQCSPRFAFRTRSRRSEGAYFAMDPMDPCHYITRFFRVSFPIKFFSMLLTFPRDVNASIILPSYTSSAGSVGKTRASAGNSSKQGDSEASEHNSDAKTSGSITVPKDPSSKAKNSPSEKLSDYSASR